MQKPLVPVAPLPKVEDRRPPSEKLLEKKWTIKRRIVQNILARYNYYYHANKKLHDISHTVARQGQDNYNYLLPFYPYSLQSLGLSKSDLDSVIEKASINIQIRDPRSKWIDDSYFVIGEAYFFQAEWDKANRTFQYINTTYAPKKKDDNKAFVGSSQNDQISISSREKHKPPLGWIRHTYARNDAFIWRAKTLLEQKEFDEARSLVNILEHDPFFPKRLDGQLAELKAYTLYKQERFAEAITPMVAALKTKHNRDEKARMSYILGQLYTNYNNPDSALYMFRKVIKAKPDPMMDFQARMQIAKLGAITSGGSLEKSLAVLQKMVKKEKYYPFRDAIYYTMANLVVAKDPDAALGYLQQSLKVESNNTLQKSLTYKAIADIYYQRRQYRFAKNFYDSTASVMPKEFVDTAVVNTRKRVLTDVVVRVEAIQREDSLQRIAAMPESERNIFLEKLAGNIRKDAEEKAKKDKLNAANNTDQGLANNPFGNSGNNTNLGPKKDDAGDWYFYNTTSKTSGFSEFKKRWGNRTLSDNWRKSQNAVASINQPTQPEDDNGDPLATPGSKTKATVRADSTSAKSLAVGLPITPDDLLKSNIIVEEAMFDLGKLYHDKLDNTLLGIETYDTLLQRYPRHPRKPEVMYSLYLWNNQLNRTAVANSYRQGVVDQYGDSKFASMIKFGGLQDVNKAKKKEISAAYGEMYEDYLGGKYMEALDKKKVADTTFGLNFMQPKFDLLEAMILMRIDTCEFGRQAITAVLNKYQQDEAIHAKAQSLLDALNDRPALVVYLSMLEVEKQKGRKDSLDENISMRYPWQNPQPKFDSVKLKTATADSLKLVNNNLKIAPLPPPLKPITLYKLNAANPHFVVLSFQRVSKALIDEGLNQFTRYNAEKHAGENIQVASFVLSPNEVMIIFRLFPNEDKALEYYDDVRVAAEKVAPKIRPSDYSFFIISRDNFIQLNSTKDIDGYKKFFNDNYITQ
jgi:TolA-binding protein